MIGFGSSQGINMGFSFGRQRKLWKLMKEEEFRDSIGEEMWAIKADTTPLQQNEDEIRDEGRGGGARTLKRDSTGF